MSRMNTIRGLALSASALALGMGLMATPAMAAPKIVVVGTPQGAAPGAVGSTALKGTIALGADGQIVINQNDNSEDGYVIHATDTTITGAAGSRIDLLSGTTTLVSTGSAFGAANGYATAGFAGTIAVHDGATLQLEGWLRDAANFNNSAGTGNVEIQKGGTLTGHGYIANNGNSNFTVAGTVAPHGYPEHGNTFDGPQGLLYIGTPGAGIATFTSTSLVQIDIDPNAPTGTRASDQLRIRMGTNIQDGAQLQIRLPAPLAGPTNYQLGTKFVFLDMGTDAAVGANHYSYTYDTTQGAAPTGLRTTQYVPIGSGPAPKIGDVITVDGKNFIYTGGSLVQARRELIGNFTLSPDSQTQLTHYLGLAIGSGFYSAPDLTTGKFLNIRNSLYMEIVQTKDFADDAETRNGKSAGAALQAVGTSNAAYNQIVNLKDGDVALEQMSPFFDALSGQIHVGVRGLLTQDAGMTERSVSRRLSNYEPGGAHMWAEAMGGSRQLDSDGELPDIKEEGQGFLAGIDATIKGPWRLGFAGGYRSADVTADDLYTGKADVDQWQGLIYTSGSWGKLRAQAGVGMAKASIETERSVFLPGIVDDHLSAEYDSTIVHAFGELSYVHDLSHAVVEPFLGYSIVRANADAADEVSMNTEEPSAVALHVGGDQTQVSFATLGVKGHTISTGPLSLDGMLGWRRGFGDLDLQSVQMLNNREGFTVNGGNLSESAAVIQVGAHWRVSDKVTLDANYDGVIGDEGQDHTAHMGVSVRF